MRSKLLRFIGCEVLVVFTVLCLWAVPQAQALQEINGCTLVNDPANDGDSFRVRTPEDGEHVVRLYYVDSPETTVGTPADAGRVRDQTAWFGLPSHAETVSFGRQAAARTRELLREPFTIHTSFAAAGGRSREGRIYAFVVTADGRDLAEILVNEGQARVFGVRRETPAGVHRDEAVERLRDLELAAALERRGAWSRSDPERLVALRAEERAAALRLQGVLAEVRAASAPVTPPDLNTASREELMLLPGIGPVRAQAIIDKRPYHKFDDLLQVEGIGRVTVEMLSEHARLGEIRP